MPGAEVTNVSQFLSAGWNSTPLSLSLSRTNIYSTVFIPFFRLSFFIFLYLCYFFLYFSWSFSSVVKVCYCYLKFSDGYFIMIFFQGLPVSFLDAFAKFRKTVISSVMFVCPSVRLEQLGSHWADFHEINVRIFFENLEKIQIW
jgi:hypothetical protein